MNTNYSAMKNMLCSSAEHDTYVSHSLMDVSVSNPKPNVKSPCLMQHPLNAGSDRSVGTEPPHLLLESTSLPTVMCNSDLIIYMFSINKSPTWEAFLA